MVVSDRLCPHEGPTRFRPSSKRSSMWAYEDVFLFVSIREMRSQCVRHVADYRCPLPRVFAVASEQRPCKSYFPRGGACARQWFRQNAFDGGSVLGSYQFRILFRNPSNYSKGLKHFAKMAVSIVQVLGFEPFSNRFRTFFEHRFHPACLCVCVGVCARVFWVD